MTPPATVSLQVPYTNTEQQFLILAVQTAVRTFRSMNGHSGDRTLTQSSPDPSNYAPPSSKQSQKALTES